jgi:putative CocE/NonD family hydrolase
MLKNDLRFLLDVRIPMRDGVKLSTDIFMPAKEGCFPVILQRTPYDNSSPHSTVGAAFFARHGYAFAIQDVRGRCDSEGEWDPWMNEHLDGYDTIEWIAKQPWCDGKVGMMGGSYLGFVQWMAARERPPHLVTLAATVSLGRWGHEFPFMNGKTNLMTLHWLNMVGGRTNQQTLDENGEVLIDWETLFRHRPLIDMDLALGRTNTVWREWMKHISLNDDYWLRIMLNGYYQHIDLPVLHITGWFDDDQVGALNYYKGMINESPAKDKQYLIIGPWDHSGTRRPKTQLGDLEFSDQSVLDIRGIHLRWFNHWLKGEKNGVDEDPRVRIYTMEREEWKEAQAWPLPQMIETAFYFHSEGSANSRDGDGKIDQWKPKDEPEDRYIYDPEDPTPGVENLVEQYYLPIDQYFAEPRKDVLVYTSDPLEEEIEVTGIPYVVLYVASDAIDTDFAAVLTNVFPDGRSIRVAENIMRASYRDSLSTPKPIEPGRIYCYKIELNGISLMFKKGHRIRVDVMSARFPTWSRNPNTGEPEGYDAETIPAHQTLYHDGMHPSHILLPVIPS